MRIATWSRPCFSERIATLPPAVICVRARRSASVCAERSSRRKRNRGDVRPERGEQLRVHVEHVLEGDRRGPAGGAVVHDDGEDRRQLLARAGAGRGSPSRSRPGSRAGGTPSTGRPCSGARRGRRAARAASPPAPSRRGPCAARRGPRRRRRCRSPAAGSPTRCRRPRGSGTSARSRPRAWRGLENAALNSASCGVVVTAPTMPAVGPRRYGDRQAPPRAGRHRAAPHRCTFMAGPGVRSSRLDARPPNALPLCRGPGCRAERGCPDRRHHRR